jgi:hypothetical protein
MLQTDLRGDTPAARQRFTDRRREHEFARYCRDSLPTLLMRAVPIAVGACNPRPLLCRSYPASRFDRAPPVGSISHEYFRRTPQYTVLYTPRVAMYRAP